MWKCFEKFHSQFEGVKTQKFVKFFDKKLTQFLYIICKIILMLVNSYLVSSKFNLLQFEERHSFEKFHISFIMVLLFHILHIIIILLLSVLELSTVELYLDNILLCVLCAFKLKIFSSALFFFFIYSWESASRNQEF